MNIQYNTATNSYYRDGETIKTWSSLVFAYSNIQLKVENDWRMSYLACTEGSTEAFIEWHFDFSDAKKVKEVHLKCKTDCFESGEVKWSIISDNSRKIIPINLINGDLNIINAEDCELNKFKLRVELRKGNGSNAFQHTQLFRQKLDDTCSNLFQIDSIFS